jgi:hypothetical protein
MEIIHPPGGYFQRKERDKSPFVTGDFWLGQGTLSQAGITQSFLLFGSHPCFSVGTSFQAGFSLNP